VECVAGIAVTPLVDLPSPIHGFFYRLLGHDVLCFAEINPDILPATLPLVERLYPPYPNASALGALASWSSETAVYFSFAGADLSCHRSALKLEAAI